MTEESSGLPTTTFSMPDGRLLHLYGEFSGPPDWQGREVHRVTSSSHRRWHPIRREWVVYSAHRQSRTYKPAQDACPFCPNAPDGELPLDAFSIAVFDNRFSSLQLTSPKPEPIPGLKVDDAKGNCEVIVYSSDHTASMGTLAQSRRELLVKVWGDRIRALLEMPAVRFVMPFENRGEEAGVTLHHPHGQIYAFSYLPPIVENMVAGFREGFRLAPLATDETYRVADTATVSAFVPPFARFPYEVWIAPKAFRPRPSDLTADEVADCARLLGQVAGMYDTFFQRITPYIMIVYAAPKGEEAHFPFHIQFYPLSRTSTKLKYLAGCELGAGTFLADVLPEQAARSLRETKAEMPS